MMNERIKELIQKMDWEEMGTDLWGKTNDGYMTTYALEKFAELIVRECAEFVDYRLTNPNGASMAWCDGSDIKEHFGVE